MSGTNQKTELLVGVFFLCGLLLLGALTFQFGRFRGGDGDRYTLLLVVRDAAGLRRGAPVRLGGVEIGEVGAAPRLGEDFSKLEVVLSIESGIRVPRGSTFGLATSGLLGDSYVRITPPEEVSEFYVAGDRIAAGSGARSIDDVATGAVETLDQAAVVLAEVGESVESINRIFRRFDEELLDPENLENVRTLLADLRASSERIERASRRIDPVLEGVESATAETRDAARSANEAFVYLEEEVGTLSKDLGASLDGAGPMLEEFDGTLDELRETLASLDRLLVRIERGGGLASALIHDGELRGDMESFLDKLERHGILRYPRDTGARNSSSPRRSEPQGASEEPAKKRTLFPLFRKRSSDDTP